MEAALLLCGVLAAASCCVGVADVDNDETILFKAHMPTAKKRPATRGSDRDDRSRRPPPRSPSTCGPWTHAEDKAFAKGMYAGPVDVVFLWANSTDPAYYSSKQATMEKYNHTLKWMRDHKKWSMTEDNGELRMSVQLVLQNLPWVRYVYIVSNGGQRPGWLPPRHARVRVVNADALLERAWPGVAATPSFNSHSLYLALPHIEGISELFLQLDDDFFITSPLSRRFFFYWSEGPAHYNNAIAGEGQGDGDGDNAPPIVRRFSEVNPVAKACRGDLKLQRHAMVEHLPHAARAADLSNKGPRGKCVAPGAHTPRVWNVTRVRAVCAAGSPFKAMCDATVANPFRRSATDLDLTSFYPHYVHQHHGVPMFLLLHGRIWVPRADATSWPPKQRVPNSTAFRRDGVNSYVDRSGKLWHPAGELAAAALRVLKAPKEMVAYIHIESRSATHPLHTKLSWKGRDAQNTFAGKFAIVCIQDVASHVYNKWGPARQRTFDQQRREFWAVGARILVGLPPWAKGLRQWGRSRTRRGNRTVMSASSHVLPPGKASTRVVGHRGNGLTQPRDLAQGVGRGERWIENSMGSLNALAAHGGKWAEIDVARTQDGVVVVSHSQAKLHEGCKLAAAHPVVATASYATLKKVDPPVPRLVDVLKVFRGRLRFQIELKQYTDYGAAKTCNKVAAGVGVLGDRSPSRPASLSRCEPGMHTISPREHGPRAALIDGVIDALEEAKVPPDDVVVTSFEGPRLAAFGIRCPRFGRHMKLIGAFRKADGAADVAIRTAQQWGLEAVALSLGQVKRAGGRAFVQEVRRSGVKVAIGDKGHGNCMQEYPVRNITASETAGLRTAILLGPDHVTTDFPREGMRLVKKAMVG